MNIQSHILPINKGDLMSKERVKQYRLRQKELGRLKREMYLTDVEFTSLKDKLIKLRFKKESPNDR